MLKTLWGVIVVEEPRAVALERQLVLCHAVAEPAQLVTRCGVGALVGEVFPARVLQRADAMERRTCAVNQVSEFRNSERFSKYLLVSSTIRPVKAAQSTCSPNVNVHPFAVIVAGTGTTEEIIIN